MGSASLGGIEEIAAAASLIKQKNKYELPLVSTKKEEHVPFSEGGIAAMAAYTVLKKKKQIT